MKLLLPILLGLFLITACNSDKKKATSDASMASAEEDFADFYKRFLRDTAYQMAHIDFPLSGLPEQADSSTIATGVFTWKKENWVIHQAFDVEKSGFDVQLQWLSETLVEERLSNREIGLGMMRRFSKTRDGWFLIYYAGMNRIK